MDHLATTRTAMGTSLPAQHAADAAPDPSYRKLAAGKAVTLRAKQLSVLRIAHGRVWATLSDAGPYSRALAGDHFLSRGQSLTLLPGQALVMESFESSAGQHAAAAHFSWEAPGAAASALQKAQPADQATDMGVRQPLRDLRHALGLVAGASGRLVRGLANGAATGPLMLFNSFAMHFVAERPRTSCPDGAFGITKKHRAPQAASCSAR
jgi:Protein of unknown function (DUF2917)